MSESLMNPNSRKKIVSGILLIIFLFSFSIFSFLSKPKTAEAQIWVPTFDSLNLAQNSVTAANTTAVSNKEFILDGIITSASKVVLANITNSIVTWINSGFQGSPAFIGNPEGFLTDVADQIVGDFIAGADLNGDEPGGEIGFLCEPFQLDIRLALNLSYSSNYVQKNFCRLSDVIRNVENFGNFTAGDFSKGGWGSWFELTQTQSGNPLSAYGHAQSEIVLRTSRAKEIKLLELDWGEGFLSWRDCLEEDPETGECTRESDIQTPGSVIESQLNDTLGSGMRQLEIADEINEIVGALVGQLAKTVLTQGLASFGSGGSNYGSLGDASEEPLTVWCGPNVLLASVGQLVTWTSTVVGGSGQSTSYVWGGDTPIFGSAPQVAVTYTTPGTKRANLRVSKGSQAVFQNCAATVLVE